jgi:DedD protein
MGLLSFFQRRSNAAEASPRSVGPHDEVALARTRARRRLLGAAVLVMAGVIGFPLVFETQPRPVPVDIPIEIPRKDGSPSLTMPPARTPAAKASGVIVASPRDDAASPADAPREPVASASAAVARQPASAAQAKKPDAEPPRAPAPTAANDAARAKALLEARPEPKPAPAKAAPAAEPAREGGRFVVQAGAFADAAAAREMRARLEKLGLKSYTQVVETSAGNRTRVRAGPFATREEAEKALAKAKAAGVGAVVLTL